MPTNSPYLSSLIRIVNEEMPQLAYDIENRGSAVFAQQEIVRQIHKILLYMLHHQILDAGGSPEPVQQTLTPAFVPPAFRRPVSQGLPSLTGAPAARSPEELMMPGPSQVTEIIVTPTGTRVIPPAGSGPGISVPPGAPVDATFGGQNGQRIESQLPPPPSLNADGTLDVVVVPTMTPETKAALAAAGVAT